MPAVWNALVVGGGIGGLTVATSLRQHGIEVDLIEINPDLSVYGVGIIQPSNTLRALDQIGLADECIARGGAFKGWRMHDGAGQHLFDGPSVSDASPRHPPINGITRPILHDVLTEAANRERVNIILGAAIDRMDDKGNMVDVRLTNGDAGSYDIVIGCDGAWSDLRRRLFGPMEPVYTGQGVWRYNLPRPADMDWGHLYNGHRAKVGLVPMSPSLMYMFVVSHEPGNPRFPDDQLAKLMRERIEGMGGPIPELAEQIIDPSAVVYRPIHYFMLDRPWHKGRAIVIGDASHASTPHLNQGAAIAIEDAVLLGQLLGESDDLDVALDTFMDRRFTRAKYVVETSKQIVDWEMEIFAGIENPEARPGQLHGEATMKLMEVY